MAEENKTVIVIQSVYENKGEIQAKKGMNDLVKKANEAGKATEALTKEGTNSFNLFAKSVAKVTANVAVFKGGLDFFTSSISAYQASSRSVDMLAAAYKNVGYTASGAMEQAQAFASKMQSMTGLADEKFLDAQRTLANYKVVGAQAQEAIEAAYALSANQGMDFEAALMLIARAAAGSASTLTRYGIVLGENIKEGDKFEAVLKQINEQFGASAQATMGDSITKTNALKESWGDFQEQVGAGLTQAFVPLMDFLTGSVGLLQKLFTAGGNYYDWLFGVIQTGVAGAKTAFLGMAAMAVKSFEKIISVGSKLHLIPQGVAEVAQRADEWITQATKDAAQQTSTLNRMRSSITDIWPEEQQITDEQKKQLDLNAQEVNAKRDLKAEAAEVANAEKKATQEAEKELEVTKQKTDELKRQQEIVDNMGLSSSEDLKGWDRNANESVSGPTELETFAGGASQLATAENAVMQYEAEAERLEELRRLKQEYIDQEITDEALKQEALQNLEQQYSAQRIANDKKSAQARQQVYGSMWSALTGLASSENKKVAAVGKVASIAQATMSMFTGAAKALELPFPANLAAVATVLAQGAALVSQIEAVKLAKGGLVKAVTGGVPAVIGEGGSDEAVLPLDSSIAMRRIGGAIAEESGSMGQAGAITVNVNITASGGLSAFFNELTEATQNGVTEALRYANVAVKAGNEQSGYSV